MVIIRAFQSELAEASSLLRLIYNPELEMIVEPGRRAKAQLGNQDGTGFLLCLQQPGIPLSMNYGQTPRTVRQAAITCHRNHCYLWFDNVEL